VEPPKAGVGLWQIHSFAVNYGQVAENHLFSTVAVGPGGQQGKGVFRGNYRYGGGGKGSKGRNGSMAVHGAGIGANIAAPYKAAKAHLLLVKGGEIPLFLGNVGTAQGQIHTCGTKGPIGAGTKAGVAAKAPSSKGDTGDEGEVGYNFTNKNIGAVNRVNQQAVFANDAKACGLGAGNLPQGGVIHKGNKSMVGKGIP